MLKKILLTLFLMTIPIEAFTMEEEETSKEISSPRTFSIDPQLLQEGVDYELHFFWTTGVRTEDLTLSQRTKQIPIGGSTFFEKFQFYFAKFLEDPLAPCVRFVTDELTLNTNLWLNTLKEKHSQRFFISLVQEVEDHLIEDVTRQVNKEFSVFDAKVLKNGLQTFQ